MNGWVDGLPFYVLSANWSLCLQFGLSSVIGYLLPGESINVNAVISLRPGER